MERIFNGALGLIGVLMAVFTYAFVSYLGESGSYRQAFLVLTGLTAAMLIACGGCALWAHLRLGDAPILLHRTFNAVLALACATPVFIWALTP